MGKHLRFNVKIEYIKDFLDTSYSVFDLGQRLIKNKLSNSLGNKTGHGRNTPGSIIIYQWVYKYKKYGIFGLMNKSNKKKKKTWRLYKRRINGNHQNSRWCN